MELKKKQGILERMISNRKMKKGKKKVRLNLRKKKKKKKQYERITRKLRGTDQIIKSIKRY